MVKILQAFYTFTNQSLQQLPHLQKFDESNSRSVILCESNKSLSIYHRPLQSSDTETHQILFSINITAAELKFLSQTEKK